MQKVWQILIGLCLLTTTLNAEVGTFVSSDAWVDSMYQKMTVAERIGQLIDVRIEPNKENVINIVDAITRNHVGSVTITGGDAEASILLINSLKEHMKVPVFVSAEAQKSLNLPFSSASQLPEISTFVQADDSSLLLSSVDKISEIFHGLGIHSSSFSMSGLVFSEKGLAPEQGKALPAYFNEINSQFEQNGIISNKDFYFTFSDDIAFSPRTMDSWNSNTWRSKIHVPLQDVNSNLILTIKSLPEFPANEALHFNKKILKPLLWKHLQFGGLLQADFDAISKTHYLNEKADIFRSLIKLGSDKIVVTNKVDEVFSALMQGLDNNYFRQNEIKDKVKRVLAMKYDAGLTKSALINDAHAHEKINDPFLEKLSYKVYTKALNRRQSDLMSIPIKELASTSFASMSLGYSELNIFQETMDKYAPMVHYKLPNVAFDPHDLNALYEQLIQFDYVIIGLHTEGLMEFDHSTLSFLNQLNSKTNIVLVFLGKAVNSTDFEHFENQIFVHEDNKFTQQLAAQAVFGAIEAETERLSYSLPEMQKLDSKTLDKIDAIAKEAIAIGATPGCQILVARNGSIVLEKGYGYYTYDSIMPVDTRTMYDLASITKVAATTQALMKLEEDGLIHLDSSLAAYLPELKGSNKATLGVRDVLAHQSGLRAFYPFWRNTIEDEKMSLHYYNDKPHDEYQNTVAYGMFAANELKDSLWHWTVDTKLRRKDKFEPYDYKYSDLGFYLLQVLVERLTNQPLDEYLHTEFYQSMGLSTMGFNPLCKFPLKRITPTEWDNTFRNVLVWGTVHDQIAAMKGGVSGHAGLFGNSHDVAKIMQMQLQGGVYGGKRYLKEETIKKFTSQQHENSRRGLGWDKPEKGDEYNPASRYSSFDSFGHSGFTGTVVWADPTFDLIYVFLSNRIYPESSNNKLSDFNIRKRIHDVVYESIWNYGKFYN